MGLEDILKNDIVGRIKRLQESSHPLVTQLLSNPLSSRNVTARYADNALRIVETEKGPEARDAVIDAIIANHLQSVNREQLLSHIGNEHNYVNFLVYHLFMLYSAETVGVGNIGDFYYFAGRTALRPDFKLMLVAKAFKSVRALFAYTAELTPNFTDMLDMEYDAEKSTTGNVVIYRRTKDKYREQYKDVFGEFWRTALEYDDLYTRGFFLPLPLLINAKNKPATVERAYFELDEQDRCKYVMVWKPSTLELVYDSHLPKISKSIPPALGFLKAVLDKNRYTLSTVKDLVSAVRDTRRTRKLFESPEFQALLAASVRMDIEVQRRGEKIKEEYQARMDAERAAYRLLAEVDHSNFYRIMVGYIQNTLQPPLTLSEIILKHQDDLHAIQDYIVGYLVELANASKSGINRLTGIDEIASRYFIETGERIALAQSLRDAIDFSQRDFDRYGISVESELEDVATPKRYGKEFFFAYINILTYIADAILEGLEDGKDKPRKILVRTRETDSDIYVDFYDTGKPFSKEQTLLLGKPMVAIEKNRPLDIGIISSAYTAKEYGGELLAARSDKPEYSGAMTLKLPKGAI